MVYFTKNHTVIRSKLDRKSVLDYMFLLKLMSSKMQINTQI